MSVLHLWSNFLYNLVRLFGKVKDFSLVLHETHKSKIIVKQINYVLFHFLNIKNVVNNCYIYLKQ